ncbi:MAG: hypothetical protein Q9227_007132 [Pyrenula ochraceoflavens]
MKSQSSLSRGTGLKSLCNPSALNSREVIDLTESPPPSSTSSEGIDSSEADYLLALKLQAQLDAEDQQPDDGESSHTVTPASEGVNETLHDQSHDEIDSEYYSEASEWDDLDRNDPEQIALKLQMDSEAGEYLTEKPESTAPPTKKGPDIATDNKNLIDLTGTDFDTPGTLSWESFDPDSIAFETEKQPSIPSLPFTDQLPYLRSYAQNAGSTVCRSGPQHNVKANLESEFTKWTQKGVATSIVKCELCSKQVCGGCGRKQEKSKKGKENGAQNTGWCCDDGRLFTIWAVLLQFEEHQASVMQARRSRLKEKYEKTLKRKQVPESPSPEKSIPPPPPWILEGPNVPNHLKPKPLPGHSTTPTPNPYSSHHLMPLNPTPNASLKPLPGHSTIPMPTIYQANHLAPSSPTQNASHSMASTTESSTSFPPYPSGPHSTAPSPQYPISIPSPFLPSQDATSKAPHSNIHNPSIYGISSPGFHKVSKLEQTQPAISQPAHQQSPMVKGPPGMHSGKFNEMFANGMPQIFYPYAIHPEDPRNRLERSGTHLPMGIGYGGSRSYTPYSHSEPIITKSDAADEKLIGKVMSLLVLILPDLRQDTQFDISPPAALLPMLAVSSILNQAADLLRNDSVVDATKRASLYHTVLDFMGSIAQHFAISDLLISERKRYPQGLKAFKELDTNQAFPHHSILSSIKHYMKKLVKQCRAMQERASTTTASFDDDEAQDMLLICSRVIELDNNIICNAFPSPIQFTKNSNPIVDGRQDTWEEYNQQNSIVDVDDALILQSHAFSTQAHSLANSRPGRMKRLVEETVTLQTSLPQGIFVRHGTSRPDVMKILIVGPADTPYEGGLFEFDAFCPADYPNTPPLFKFRTTGGGRASFNPNLYPCGKVCLSLINTWSGEQWSPQTSTLLQVLVSLQSMIFCEHPWYNEPGREHYPIELPAIRAYDQSVQILTTQHAMVGWMEKAQQAQTQKERQGKGGLGVWEEVVREYFKKKEVELVRTVEGWVRGGNRELERIGAVGKVREKLAGMGLGMGKWR